jgi:tetratricopeptide (TPR) repeat protein
MQQQARQGRMNSKEDEMKPALFLAPLLLLLSVAAGCGEKSVPLPKEDSPAIGPDSIPPHTLALTTRLEEGARRDNLAGEHAKAAEKLEKALIIYQQFGYHSHAAVKYLELGFFYGNHNNPDKGARYIIAAYDVALAIKGPDGEAMRDKALTTLHQLASNLVTRNEVKAARDCWDQAVKYLREKNDFQPLAQALHNRAWILADVGKFSEAAAQYEEALSLRVINGRPDEIAWTRNNLGWVLIKKGDIEKAAEHLYRAYYIAASQDFWEIQQKIGENLELLSIEAARRGRLAWAVKNDERILKKPGKDITPFRTQGIMLRLARNLARVGRLDESLEIFKSLIRQEQEKENPYGQAIFWNARARSLFKAGEKVKAARSFGIGLALQQEIGDRLGEAETLVDLAGLAKTPEAAKLLLRADEIFGELDNYLPGREAVLVKRIALLEAGKTQEIVKLGAELEALRKKLPLTDLEKIEIVHAIEERGKILSRMKPSDSVILVTRTVEGWNFIDLPTGKKIQVPLRYRARNVFFQGFRFRLFGQTLMHRTLSFFLRPGEKVLQRKDLSVVKVRR